MEKKVISFQMGLGTFPDQLTDFLQKKGTSNYNAPWERLLLLRNVLIWTGK